MPELAEVEYYRKQWALGFGRAVRGVELNAGKRVFRDVDTQVLAGGLIGQRLTRSATHGKQMCFVFGDRHWLGVHLGMTGKTCAVAGDYTRQKHDHLVLQMEDGVNLVFTDPRMFGRLRYAESAFDPDWWAKLPPEVLSDGFTFGRMERFLERRGKAPIKAVLLMQEVFPGIGNWMADEILWRSRIQPATRAAEIGPRKRVELFNTVQGVCADAMRVIGTDWGTPPDSWFFNHRWKGGGTCPQTGMPLTRAEIGGRTTCWSPKWQTYRGVA